MNASADRVRLSLARPVAAAQEDTLAAADVDASRVLQLQAAVLAQPRFASAAAAFVNALAELLGARRACLGWVEHGSAEIVAMSGEVDFQRNAEVCRAMAVAMDEAIEQGASITYPSPPGARPRVTLAHGDIARRSGSSLLTVPLVSGGRLIGALTLEFRGDEPPGEQGLASCERMVCLIAPLLELKRDADLSWTARLGLASHSVREQLAQPGHWRVKAGLLASLPLAAVLCCWPVEYRVSAPAHLEGAVQRMLVAPADGFLRDANVKPGDQVKEGQVLAVLADQDLELERRKWASEQAQQENNYLSALAKGERTQYVVNFGRADAARAQLELVQQQILRSRLRAPFDGVVIKGDLSQSLGAPVQRGDVLLTIAPANAYRLIVEVDERDIADVRLGQQGALALAALPHATLDFRVVRVTPVATAKDGRNFYEVEAQLDATPAGMRPGLQGVAKIAASQQSLAWIWTHRVADWTRLAIWSLGS